MNTNPLYCPRCGSSTVTPLPSIKSILCDHCRDYKKGVIPLSYSDKPVIDRDLIININKALTQLIITHEEQATQIKNLSAQIELITE